MDQMQNSFSVLMSVYKNDDKDQFFRALESVFTNTLRPSEVVLVCDGPLSMQLWEIIKIFELSNRLVTVKLERNVGLASALNAGLLHVHSQFVIRADADDINDKDRFAILMDVLQKGFDLVGSAIAEVDNDDMEISIRRPPCGQDEIIKFARTRNPFNHNSVGFRLAPVLESGGYPNLFLREDYGLWAKLIHRKAKMLNLDQVLVRARAGDGLIRRRGGIKYALGEVRLQLHLIKYGIKPTYSGLFDGILRGVIFILPFKFRKFFYRFFLRQ